MDKIKIINQSKRVWIQLEIAKREKTNELWMIEAQIEKIKSKIKSYGMEQDLGMDEEFIAVWEGLSNHCDRSGSSSDAVRDGM
jgi:hypothetical protein